MTRDGTAWRSAASGPLVLHGSPDCQALANAEHVREVDLANYPASWRDWCTRCGPEAAEREPVAASQ